MRVKIKILLVCAVVESFKKSVGFFSFWKRMSYKMSKKKETIK